MQQATEGRCRVGSASCFRSCQDLLKGPFGWPSRQNRKSQNSEVAVCLAELQGVTDPMNLGSLLRSAAFFGVEGRFALLPMSC